MIYCDYSNKDLAKNKIKPLSDPSENTVRTSYFVGPFPSGDRVYVFRNKYEALLYLSSYIQNDLLHGKLTKEQNEEIDKLHSIIQKIRRLKSDKKTPSIYAILGKENSVSLDCDGYWDQYVQVAESYWGTWIENYVISRSEELYYEHRNDDDIDASTNEIENDFVMNYLEYDFSTSDPFNDDFVYSVFEIIPFDSPFFY